MKLLTVAAILLMVGVGVRSNAIAGNDIVNLPPADSNAESCITDDLPTNTHCDVFEDTHTVFRLDIADRTFFAHTDMVVGSVPYFRGPPDEVHSKIERLQQQHLDGSAVEALLRFVYTRQIRIDDDNVEAVLRAATFLQMDNVVAACAELFTKRIDDNNVIHKLNTGTDAAVDNTIIVNVATNYFLANIVRLSASSDFPNLSAGALVAVARANANGTTPAESLFEAILGWIRHEPPNWFDMLCELMENIRFCSMPLDYLGQHVLPVLSRINDCTRVRQTIQEAIIYQMGPADKHGLDCGTLQNTVPMAQRPDNATFWFLHTVNENSEMKVFEPALNRTRAVGKTPDKFSYCVVVHNCDIYAIGGYRLADNSDSVHVYTEASNEWRAIESMIESRLFASAVAVNGIIYVSGGFDDLQNNLVSVESYDTQAHAWSSLASMNQARFHHQLVALDDHLYAIGGRKDYESLISVEKYDISRNEWTQVAPMLKSRAMLGAAVLNKKIYVCGGSVNDGDFIRNSAEVFDPIRERWTAIAPMSTNRVFFSLVAYMDQLWAFPGEESTTEVYDPKTDSWTPYAMPFEGTTYTVVTRCEYNDTSTSDSYSQKRISTYSYE